MWQEKAVLYKLEFMLPNLISLKLLAVLLTTGISKDAPVREEVRYNLLIRDKVVGELVAVVTPKLW